MSQTDTHLYRALLGDDAKKATRVAIATDTLETHPPKPGVLDPQWTKKTFQTGPAGAKTTQTRLPDVDLVPNANNPLEFDVLANDKGTSLHDAKGWFGSKEFWIPKGTIYSDEIIIRKDDHKKWNKKRTVEGYHYQLEPKTRMTRGTFAGYLDNMARAAVVRQIEIAKAGVRV